MESPLVSIIIPAFNSENHIAETLDSALSQTYKNTEILVINDGSTDSTENIISEYQGLVKLINTKNNGVSIARNIGILFAKGKYVALLDSDDIWHPEKLMLQVDYMEYNEEVSMISNERIKFEKTHEIVFKDIPKVEENLILDHYQILHRNPIHCSSALLRRQAFAHCGLFNNQIKNASEDTELWARVASIGKLVLGRESLSWLRSHDNNMTKTEHFKFSRLDALDVMQRYWSKDARAVEIIRNNLSGNLVGMAYQASEQKNYIAATTCFRRAYSLNPKKIKFWVKFFQNYLLCILHSKNR